MAQRFRLPLLSGGGRAFSICQSSDCVALPKMQEGCWSDGWNGDGEQPHGLERLVLSSLSDRQPDTGHLRRAVSETTGSIPV